VGPGTARNNVDSGDLKKLFLYRIQSVPDKTGPLKALDGTFETYRKFSDLVIIKKIA